MKGNINLKRLLFASCNSVGVTNCYALSANTPLRARKGITQSCYHLRDAYLLIKLSHPKYIDSHMIFFGWNMDSHALVSEGAVVTVADKCQKAAVMAVDS